MSIRELIAARKNAPARPAVPENIPVFSSEPRGVFPDVVDPFDPTEEERIRSLPSIKHLENQLEDTLENPLMGVLPEKSDAARRIPAFEAPVHRQMRAEEEERMHQESEPPPPAWHWAFPDRGDGFASGVLRGLRGPRATG